MESIFEGELVNEFAHEEENQKLDNEVEDLEEREKEEEMEVNENVPLEEEEEDKEEVQQEEQIQEEPIEQETMEKEGIDEELNAKKEEEEEMQPPEEQNEANEIIGDSSEHIKEEKKEETETKESLKEEEGQGKESIMKYETVDPKTESTDNTQVKSSYTNEVKTEEKQSTTITKTAPPSTIDKKEKSTKKSKLYGCDYMRTTLSCLEVNLPKYINKIVKLAKPKEKTVEDTPTTPIEPFEKTKEITKITSENIPLVYPVLKKKHVPVILSKKASAVDEETYNMYTKDNPDYKPYIVPIEVYVPKYLNPEVGYEYMNYEIKDKEIDMEVKTKLLEQLNPHLMFYDYYKCDPYRILSDYYNLASLLFQGKAIMRYPKEEPQPMRHIKSTRVFYRRIKIVKKKVAAQ